MPRLKLNLPKSFAFSTELEVRVGDVNYGGHLGNDAVLAFIHEARLRFLDERGFSESNVGGVGLIMADSAVVYKAEAFRGDRLTVEVVARSPSTAGFELVYRLTHSTSGREVARATTGMLYFDYGRRRVARAPEEARRLFG